MAETNLKQYQIELKALLQQGRHDEVVEHCRHILKTYPRNVNVYRLLGQALLESGRFDDAEQILRRVLSVYPADAEAHRGLSQIAQHQRRYDHAIWHLERTYEQNTGDAALLKQLRDLYAAHRNLPNPRVQLTARAVAAQQKQSGMAHLAIETLQNALQTAQNRVDLRLLLAQLLWDEGRRIEAAEIALDVLRVLPDSVEANRIMTELWLLEQRPSDAQRYLNRIEAVAPYLAFHLVQGEFPRDDAFRLERLDYRQQASRQLSTAEPDWLQSLSEDGDDFDVEDSGWLDLIEEDDTFSEEVLVARDNNAAAEDADADDWLRELDDVQQETQAETRAVRPPDDVEDLFEELFADSEPMEPVDPRQTAPTNRLNAAPPAAADDSDVFNLFDFDDDASDESDLFGESSSSTGLTGLLADADPDRADSGDRGYGRVSTGLTGLLSQLSDQEDDEEETPADEPLADQEALASWNPSDDIAAEDETQLPRPIPETDYLPAANETFADSDDEGLAEEKSAAPSNDEADPFAWMRQSGVELVDESDTRPGFSPYMEEEDDIPISNTGERDPLAWLQDSGIELVEEAQDAVPVADRPDEEIVSSDDDEEDPLAWLHQSGIEIIADEEDDQESDPLDWMQDDDVLMGDYQTGILPPDAEASSPYTTQILSESGSASDEDAVDWMADDSLLDEALYLEALSTGDFPAVDLDAADTADTGTEDRQEAMADDMQRPTPDWNNEPDDEEEAEDAPVSWFADEPDTDSESGGELDWMTEAASASTAPGDIPDLFGDDDDDDAEAESPMDWTRSFDERAVPSAASAATSDDMPFDASQPFDWEADDEDEEPLEISDGPDWLSMVADDEDEEESTSEPLPGAQRELQPDWLGGRDDLSEDSDDEEDQREIDELLSLDWNADEDEDAFEETGDGVPDWLAGMGAGAAGAGITASAMNDQNDPDDEEDAEPDWLSSLSDDDEADDDSFELEPSEEPDWLAAARPPEASAGIEEDDAEEEMPDWLSTLGEDADAEELELDDELAIESDSSQPDWLVSTSAAVPGFAEDEDEESTPDWLSGVGANNEAMSFDEDEDEEESVPNWLSGVSAEDEDEDMSFDDEEEDVPSWLQEVGAASASNTIDEDEEEESVPSWLSGVGTPSDSATDWLDEDEEPAEESAEIDWLAALDSVDAEDDEEAIGEDEEPVPDWLAAVETGAGAAEFDDEEVEWSIEDETPAASGDVPDWLRGAQPIAEEDEAGGFEEIDWETEEPVANGASIFETIEEDQDLIEADSFSTYDESEALTPSPAENAPDWLNAMVPGLDLDYDAEDEEVYDESYEVVPNTAAEARREFGWLNEIVREELAPPPSMPDETAAKPRFVFSRPPLWMRSTRAASGQNSDSQDDDDLPPWLSFDNE